MTADRPPDRPPDRQFSISVLVPVLMRRADASSLRLLRRALESVLDQAYPGAFEIIVIDDGSPLPVRDAMRESGFPRSSAIRWLRSEHNDGLVQALNVGLRQARFDLIARQDADDLWMPGKIAAQVERFRADPDLSLVATGMTVVDANGKELERPVLRDGWENLLHFAAATGFCPFPHASVLARASVFRLLGGYSHDPAWTHAEDWRLWSSWVRFFKPAVVEEALLRYRRGPGTVSSEHRERQSTASRRIHRRLAMAVDGKAHPGNIRRLADILGVSLLQCGALCYRLWRFGPAVALPAAALDPLRLILPDRDIATGGDGPAPVWEIEHLAAGFPGPGRAKRAAAGGVIASCRR